MTAPSRRRLLLASASAAGAALLAPAWAAKPPVLPTPASLATELAAAQRRRKALVVMVSLEGCPPCKLVRENYLAPLLREGQPIVEIDMLGPDALAGFDGLPSTQRALTRDWGVRVAPTVLFFGRDGKEIAPRLAGMAIPDFYGAYLQDRVDAANRAA
jgi:hypothetical protein